MSKKLIVKSLMDMLDVGKKAGKVVTYPDEWIDAAPYDLRKDIAKHNEGLLGTSYRESFEKSPTYYRGSRRTPLEYDADARTGKTAGTGVFFSDNPYTASTYAGRMGGSITPVKIRSTSPAILDAEGVNWNRIDPYSEIDLPSIGYDSAADYVDFNPSYDDYLTTDEILAAMRQQGADVGFIKEVKDVGGFPRWMSKTDIEKAGKPQTTTAVFDPSVIRSTSAVLDPAKAKSKHILAASPIMGGTAGLMGLSAIMPDEARAAEIAATDTRDVGSIQAAKHPSMQKLAGLLGQIDTPVGKPFENLPNSLLAMAYGDNPDLLRSFLSATDIAP